MSSLATVCRLIHFNLCDLRFNYGIVKFTDVVEETKVSSSIQTSKINLCQKLFHRPTFKCFS